MKKLYTISLSLFIAATAIGQNKTILKKELRTKAELPTNLTATNTKPMKKSMAVIFSEDFSSGLPGTWTSTDNNGSGVLWYWAATGTSSGNYAGTMSGSGTTAATGCMVFDSDYNNGANNSVGGEDASIITPAINLTAFPNVVLSFNQFFRPFTSADIGTVSISTDGSTYTPIYTVTGAASPNPEKVEVDISSIAGGQSTVYIQFNWVGDWGYYWFVDDVVVEEVPSNDIKVSKEVVEYNWLAGYYNQVPVRQVDTMMFKTNFINFGLNAQPNTFGSITINDGTTDVFTQSTTPTTYASKDVDSIYYGPFVPSAIADYTATMTLASDSTDATPGNNIVTRTFSTSDTIYARDRGVIDGYTSSLGTASFGGDSEIDGFALMNFYDFKYADTLSSVSFQITSGSDGFGIFAQAFVISEAVTAGTFPADADIEYYSDLYEFVSGDEGSWITLPLNYFGSTNVNGDASVNASTGWYAGVRFYNASAVTPGAMRIYDDTKTDAADALGMIFYPADGNFYTNGNAFHIRLNTKNYLFSSSVKEQAASNFELKQNVPNPARTTTSISYELKSNSSVSILLTDVTGKVVMNNSLGKQNAGIQKFELNTSNLGAGMYFYTIVVDGVSATRKMNVIK